MNKEMSILVVDDQPDLVENIGLTLEGAGYTVLAASDGVEALEILASEPVDLILADIAMPRLNGYQLYERVRENPAWVAIPFLFLTARALDSDIRYGKELGVDDYLVKPIEPEDLVAAVRGKLRRSRDLSPALRQPQSLTARQDGVVAVGPLAIDSRQHQVRLEGREIKLSAKEFTALEYLARRAGQVVSPEELIRATHGLDTNAVEAGALLRPLVRSLRRRLGYRAGEMGCIENVRGVGYRLRPQ